MKAYPGQSGTGLVLYDAWAVPGVITDMCCLLKFTDHYPQPPDLFLPTRARYTQRAVPGPWDLGQRRAANSICPLFCENKPSVTICATWG